MRRIILILALCAACGHDNDNGFEPTAEEANAEGRICDAPLLTPPCPGQLACRLEPPCPGRLLCKPTGQNPGAFKTCQFP